MNTNYKIKIIPRAINDGSYSLTLHYTNKGDRQRKALGLYIKGDSKSKIKDEKTLNLAKLARDKKERELYTSSTGIVLNSSDGLNDDEDFLKFFSDQAVSSPDYNYTVSYNNFLDYINTDKLSFKELTRDLCMGYREYLLNLDVKAHTAHHYLVAFKAVINQGLIDGKIDYHPAKGINIKYDDPEVEFLLIDEVKKLIDTPYRFQQIKNGFLFSCFTGLRPSDLNKLRFDDIREFKEEETKRKIFFIKQKKTRNYVRIKLNKVAMEILEMQKKGKRREKVFKIPTGGRLSTRMKEWVTAAGIKRKITFYASRHTFGTLLAMNGEGVYTIMRLMGHKNIKTTMRYIHIAESIQDAAMDKLDEFFE